MSRLALYLLGPPRIECDGETVDLDTRKASALMAYLAVTRQRHSRDTLAALLWPEYDQAHARATLRRTLSTLNKALAGPWLEIDREHVSLNFDAGTWVDVHEFKRHLAACRSHNHPAAETCSACLQPLSDAVTLYDDDFLAGFSLRDSPSFDDWQFFQADSLRRDLSGALERLVQCYYATGDFASAIAYARRWLMLDRLHEAAHRLLMQLYAWSDQRGAALHQYRECVQVLERELGVAPLEVTTKLYQAIKERQEIPLPVPLHVPAAAHEASVAVEAVPLTTARLLSDTVPDVQSLPPSVNYPLVGRSAEWSTLMNIYDTNCSDGHMVILEGEAGIGKTRLAEEFLAYAQGKGANVIVAQCYEGETQLAFGPIVAGLRAAIAQKETGRLLQDIPDTWLCEAARLLPELFTLRRGLPTPLPLDSPGAQSRFFEGLRQVLFAICQGTRPGIIFFDDVHWADGATLDLLSYLVRRLRGQPICLVVNWRNQPTANDQRLRQLQNEALRAGKATVITLPRLSLANVTELVQSIIPASVTLSKGLVERLYQETEGLPFFLTEYLMAIASGVLSAGSEDWSPPGGVRELLASRLNTVSETGRQLLSTAAVIGRSFDFDTLREISGRSEEETVVALEELIAQGLVEEVRGSVSEQTLNYDFCHEQLRALVNEETSLARRRLLHRRVAETLVNRMRENRSTGMLAGQIAYHYQMAGNEAAAAEYFKLAGELARSLYANAEALAHLRMALALGHPDAAALHVSIGDLYTLLGEYGNALKSYETAAALCAPPALANVEHKIGNVYERRGEWDQAESHLEAALAAIERGGPSGERARIYADWSLAAYHRGQVDQAMNLAEQALGQAEAAHDIQALAQAHNIVGMLASKQQKLEEAQHHLEQSLALAGELNDLSVRVAALNNLALVCRAGGAIERAIKLTQDALALCVSQGDRHREAALHNNLADLFHAAGNSEAAMSHLKQAVSIYAEIGVEEGAVRTEIWKLAEW
jgi:DNA-binding SARP family transcriptional activator/Tfp pilus assembly protein PilF